MKKFTLAIALTLAAIGTAQADIKVRSKDNTMQATIHSPGMSWGKNNRGDFQVQAYISIVDDRETYRNLRGVTGCDKGAGHIGAIDSTTMKPLTNGMVWFEDGPSFSDAIAEAVCQEWAEQYGAQKAAKQAPTKKHAQPKKQTNVTIY